jgi:hypothetical protein
MNLTKNTISNLLSAAIFCAAMLGSHPASSAAQDASKISATLPATDLDLTIQYFNRELTPEGVLRVSSYEEKMLRRNGHVWSQRVLPVKVTENNTSHPNGHSRNISSDNAGRHARFPLPNPPPKGEGTNESLRDFPVNHEHKDFNYIVLPRHVSFDGSKVSVEFIDDHDRQVINIVPTEYENVNFDGSWPNTYYLVNPKVVAAMPLSQRPSSAGNARWHEVVKNGLFQRVLWDEKLSIPLMIETGDLKNTFLQRINVSPTAGLIKDLPWNHQQGYAQKEYSDFLD